MMRCAMRLVAVYSMCGLVATCAAAFVCWRTIDLSRDRYQVYPPGPWVSAPSDVLFPLVSWNRQQGAGWWLVLRSQRDATEAESIESIVPRWTGLWPRDWGEVAAGDEARMVAAYGWPQLAFAARSEPVIRQLDARGPLPLHPVWGGLLFDTIAFGGTIALVHQVTLAGNRRRRRCTGRCAHCGYDLTGITGPCPECGRERENLA